MKTTTIGSYPKPPYLRIPDCGLGFLPRKLCFQKLKIITKVAKSFIN